MLVGREENKSSRRHASQGRPVQSEINSQPPSTTRIANTSKAPLPPTLNLQDRLPRPSDSNILQAPTLLHLELKLLRGAKRPQPLLQRGIDDPAPLHGFYLDS